MEFDFTFPTYSAFLDRERKVEAALAKLPAGLFALKGFGPPALTLADVRSSAVLKEGTADANGSTRRWIAKIFAALGVGEVHAIFLEILEADGILALIARAIRERDWDSLKRFLKMLLRTIFSKKFFLKLVAKIGENTAARILGSILGKCLPFVGWVILIGSVIWAFAEQAL